MQPYEHDIQHCLQVFSKQGIILYPTDTVWGLGCPADDEVAIQKIMELKNRPTTKSFILLMTDVKMLLNYLANPLPELGDIVNQFTEPTTLIYSNAINLPNSVLSEQGTVAVRITQDPFCRSLIKRMRKPLVSTSANLSGEPTARVFSEIHRHIIAGCDYCVTWRQDDPTIHNPSAIYAIHDQGEMTRIR